jgi:hypothetical protein
MNSLPLNSLADQTEYSARTAEYYLEQMDANIQTSLTSEQLSAFRTVLESAIPKPSHKVVDLRVNIDLIISRFYIVLFVGKDRRKNKREQIASRLTIIANRVAAIAMLVGLNLTISLFIFLITYLIKSSLGINLFPEHLSTYLSR